MKKQEYFDMGINLGLSFHQIENILCRILQISKTKLFSLTEISSKYIYEVQKSFYNVSQGVPEAYSIENAEFYGRDFFVDNRVLIPRNDTEVLVKHALYKLNTGFNVSDSVYIDVGTGSSSIAISIILEMIPLKFSHVFGLDISLDALEVAKINIDTLVPEHIELRESNLLDRVFHDSKLKNKQLFITANLPYIKNGDFKNMDNSVIKNEPNSALYGGEKTGFELYETLIKQCFQIKKLQNLQNIVLFIEIGFDQYEYSRKFLSDMGLSFEYFQDSASIQRVIFISGF